MANLVPVANNDSYVVSEDSLLKVSVGSGVLSNDSDDNNQLSAFLVSSTANLLFKLQSNGSFTFDARNYDYLSAGESITDSFTYKVFDGTQFGNTATVTITINGINDAPVAAADSATVSAASFVDIDVLANDTDIDHLDTKTIIALADLKDDTGPAGSSDTTPGDGLTITTDYGGTVTLVAGKLRYTPLASFFGVDTFTYTISDGHGGTSTATVSVTVNPSNVAPVALNDSYNVGENGTLTVTAAGVLTNDTDADGDSLASQLLTGPAKGNLTAFGADGGFTYDPNGQFEYLGAGQSENVTFTYKALDSSGAFSTATVTITVTGVNDGPVANTDAASATEAGGVANGTAGVNPTGNVLTNDTDADTGDTKAVQGVAAGVLSGPLSSNVGSSVAGTYGSLTVGATGAYTYTVNNSNASVQGLRLFTDTLTDTFSYTMRDAAGATSTTTFVATIHGANDAPVASADTASATEAGGVANGTPGVNPTGNVLTNDTDVDSGDTKAVQGVAAGALSGPLSANVGSSVTGTYGSLTLASNGSYTYTVDNSNATVQALQTAANTVLDTFSYTMRDTAGAVSTTTLTVTIHGAADAPLATNDTNWALSQNTNPDATGNVLTGANHDDAILGAFADVADTDPDTPSGSLTVTGIRTGGVEGAGTAGVVGSSLTGAHGTLTLNANGSYTYNVNDADPAVTALIGSQFINDTFNYTVSDGTTSDIATLTISIFGGKVPPSLADRLFINEIDLSGGGGTRSAIEIINNYNNALAGTDLAQGLLEIRDANGVMHTLNLGQLLGLTVDGSGNLISGAALPGNSVLVLYEPGSVVNGVTYNQGFWRVVSGNTEKNGTFAVGDGHMWDAWNLGDHVTDPIAVNLVQGGKSIDLFIANNSPGGLSGIGSLSDGNHDLGSTSKSGFYAPLGRSGAAWWGGAEFTDATTMPADVKALLALYNIEYSGALGGTADHVFARTYDRYLVSNKGSSVDNQFIDENDSGDWTFNATGTLGIKNNSTATNSQDGTDNVNPSQGTNVHGTSTPTIPNADGQTVYWIGNSGGTLNGGNGPDFLYGGTGNDNLVGGSNNDFLYGSSGNDTQDGGTGADRLNGGAGNDRLTGGSGPDQFIFSTALSAATNVDTMTDFSHVQGDKIVLDHLIFAALPVGALSAADFAAHIVYAGGALSYDADGVGIGAAATQFATLTGSPALVFGDFLVV